MTITAVKGFYKFPIAAFLVIPLLWSSRSLSAADLPHGFFVEDLSKKKPAPAFYNLETHRVEPFPLKQSYSQFIDFAWHRDKGQVFFSARLASTDSYRVYLKNWPDGDEKPVYENPLGPFRFILSPDGDRFVLQVMGPSAWPILAIHDWQAGHSTLLGQGFSPDWSRDGQRVLFLRIPGSLPSYLYEYRVETDTITALLDDPVIETAYTDDADQIVLKTAKQSKQCDMFQLWNRRSGKMHPFCEREGGGGKKRCPVQRELGAFPGHQFFFFKEAPDASHADHPELIVTDVWGGRLQSLAPEDWEPRVTAIEETTLVVGQDPLYVLPADGTGGRIEIPKAGFIHARR